MVKLELNESEIGLLRRAISKWIWEPSFSNSLEARENTYKLNQLHSKVLAFEKEQGCND